jgi:hypothetical protein
MTVTFPERLEALKPGQNGCIVSATSALHMEKSCE